MVQDSISDLPVKTCSSKVKRFVGKTVGKIYYYFLALGTMNLFTPKGKLFNKTIIQKQGKTWWRDLFPILEMRGFVITNYTELYRFVILQYLFYKVFTKMA